MKDEREFDEFDMEIVDELKDITPPQSMAEDITPWKRATENIAAGLVMSTFTLSILYLQYILPTIGALLIYLGFRTLRWNNKWFKACYMLSAAWAVKSIISLIVLSTPLALFEALTNALSYVSVAIELLLMFCYWRATDDALKIVGEKKETNPLKYTFFWYVLVVIIALSPYNSSWLIFIPMVIFYIIAICALVELNKKLATWGYTAQTAPVKIDSAVLSKIYLWSAVILVLALSLISNNVSPEDKEELYTKAYSEERMTLKGLGVPEEILAEISDEDLEGLENTTKCTVMSKELDFSEGYSYAERSMKVTTIYAETSEEMRVIVYFEWTKKPKVFWQDGVSFIAEGRAWSENYQYNYDLVDLAGEVSGRLIWDKGNETYTAKMPKLNCGDVTHASFLGAYNYKTLTGMVGYPLGAKNPRGYIMMPLEQVWEEGDAANWWASFNYCHKGWPINIPYENISRSMSQRNWITATERQSYTSKSWDD